MFLSLLITFVFSSFYLVLNQEIQFIGAGQFRATSCSGSPDLLSYFQTDRCVIIGPGVNIPAVYQCQENGTVLQQLFSINDTTCSGEPTENITLSIGECQGPYRQFPQESSPGFLVISCDSNQPPFGVRPPLFPAGEGDGMLLSTGIFPVQEDVCGSDPFIAYFQRPNICGLNLNATGHIISSELVCVRDEVDEEVIYLDQSRYIDPSCQVLDQNLVLPANICQTNLFNGTIHVISRCDNVPRNVSEGTSFPDDGNDNNSDQVILGSILASVFGMGCLCISVILIILFFILKNKKEGRILEDLRKKGLLNNIKIIDPNEISIEPEPLGEGISCVVKKAVYSGSYVAVKIPNVVNSLQETVDEFKIHSEIPENPNIVKFLGFTIDELHLCIVLEFCDKGSLGNYLRDYSSDENESIPDSRIFQWICEISNGISCIHERGIIHRDIAARNVLLQSNENLTAKIADFGFSRKIHKGDNETYHSSSNVFPLKWIAPECFKKEFSRKTDVWSFGIVILEILTRKLPFSNVDQEDFLGNSTAYLADISTYIPVNTPECLNKVLNENIFQNDPKQRLSMAELHSLFLTPKFKKSFNQQRRMSKTRGSMITPSADIHSASTTTEKKSEPSKIVSSEKSVDKFRSEPTDSLSGGVQTENQKNPVYLDLGSSDKNESRVYVKCE